LACFLGEIALSPHAKATDERKEKLLLLALDICREPRGMSGLELAAVWAFFLALILGRPTVCATAINAGLYEIGVAALNAIPPAERIGWRTPAGIQAGAIFAVIVNTIINNPPGISSIQLVNAVIDTGVADAAVSILQVRMVATSSFCCASAQWHD
jgi:hypothetical protein